MDANINSTFFDILHHQQQQQQQEQVQNINENVENVDWDLICAEMEQQIAAACLNVQEPAKSELKREHQREETLRHSPIGRKRLKINDKRLDSVRVKTDSVDLISKISFDLGQDIYLTIGLNVDHAFTPFIKLTSSKTSSFIFNAPLNEWNAFAKNFFEAIETLNIYRQRQRRLVCAQTNKRICCTKCPYCNDKKGDPRNEENKSEESKESVFEKQFRISDTITMNFLQQSKKISIVLNVNAGTSVKLNIKFATELKKCLAAIEFRRDTLVSCDFKTFYADVLGVAIVRSASTTNAKKIQNRSFNIIQVILEIMKRSEEDNMRHCIRNLYHENVQSLHELIIVCEDRVKQDAETKFICNDIVD